MNDGCVRDGARADPISALSLDKFTDRFTEIESVARVGSTDG